MTRVRLRRAGGLFLLLVWAPVATANALPCAVHCMLEAALAGAHGMGGQDPMMAHHGATMCPCGHCSTPQLLVVAFVPPEMPAPPSVEVAVSDMPVAAPLPLLSTTPEFGTPPPRV
jgi:hypothetical protein